MRVELALADVDLGGSNIAVGIDADYLSRLQLPNRSFARLALLSEKVSRVVQLVPIQDKSSGVIFLSPMLALRFDRALLFERFLKEPSPRVEAKLTPLMTTPRRKAANRVLLQRIGWPTREFDVLQRSTTSFDEIITQAIRQYVAAGDVLAFPVELAFPAADDHNGLRYYRVVSVEPDDADIAYYVSPATTHVALMVQKTEEVSHLMEDVIVDRMGPLLPHWKEVAEIVAPLLVYHPHLSYRLGLLLHGSCGKTTALRHAARALGMKYIQVECLDLPQGTVGDVYQTLDEIRNDAKKFTPCFVVLHHLQFLMNTMRQENEAEGDPNASAVIATVLHEMTKQSIQDCESCVVLVATCDTPQSLVPMVRHVFTHEMHIPPLDAEQRMQILEFFFDQFAIRDAVSEVKASLHLISEQLVGPTPRDLCSICYRLRAAHRQPNIFLAASDVCLFLLEEKKLQLKEVEEILFSFFRRPGSQKSTVEVPKVEWGDIGGLDDVKALIKETVELPIKHRSLFATGLQKRVGVLLHGPPGVGKTLLAKAIATECQTTFMSIKGPELLNMYVGETERLIRELFDRAKKASPCVLFFDELDAFVPSRGGQESGSAMDCVVSQFLAELDGVASSSCDVFVFGATNRIDLIDPALLRPGRLDKLVEVGLPKTVADKCSVLQSLTRKFHLAQDVDLMFIAQEVKESSSGADLYAICSDAWIKACKRHIASSSRGDSTETDVRQRDFLEAVKGLHS